jgi:3-mercaptopyruvate sulfurtransferase SseA
LAGKLNRRMVIPIIMIIAGVSLIAGSLWWSINSSRVVAVRPPTATMTGQQIPSSQVQRVSLADAKAAFDLKQAVFVDVRGEPYYSERHIPGALSIPLEELTDHLNELKHSDWIILYCT